MGKYEYIGKREILRRVRALGYFVRSARDCSYKKSLKAWNGWSLQKSK